jgi:hypothetical protein
MCSVLCSINLKAIFWLFVAFCARLTLSCIAPFTGFLDSSKRRSERFFRNLIQQRNDDRREAVSARDAESSEFCFQMSKQQEGSWSSVWLI